MLRQNVIFFYIKQPVPVKIDEVLVNLFCDRAKMHSASSVFSCVVILSSKNVGKRLTSSIQFNSFVF